jgi:hypothetical protein
LVALGARGDTSLAAPAEGEIPFDDEHMNC